MKRPRTKILFKILDLFPHLFQLALDRDRQPRQGHILRLRADGIHLPSHFLQPEFDFLADRLGTLEKRAQGFQVSAQAGQLFGDIGALRRAGGLFVKPLFIQQPHFFHPQGVDQVSHPLLELQRNRLARLLGQMADLLDRGSDSSQPRGHILSQRAPFAGTFLIERFQGSGQSLPSDRNFSRNIGFGLSKLENFRSLQQHPYPQLAIEVKKFLQGAQFLDVGAGQALVDQQPSPRARAAQPPNRNLDSSSADHRSHLLAQFRFGFAPTARQVELDLQKALIDRAHFRADLHSATLDPRSPVAGHTAHRLSPFSKTSSYSAIVPRAIACKLKRSTMRIRAASPIRARKWGEPARAARASANAAGAPGATSHPLRSCSTISGIPPAALATTACPHAIASSNATPSPSFVDGCAKISMAQNSARGSARPPSKATRPVSPAASAWACRAWRCEPSPASSSRGARPRRLSRASASIRWRCPFRASRLPTAPINNSSSRAPSARRAAARWAAWGGLKWLQSTPLGIIAIRSRLTPASARLRATCWEIAATPSTAPLYSHRAVNRLGR